MARLAGKGRHYKLALLDHDGNVTGYTYDFISVTSVLDAVVAKPKLMHWYYNKGLEGVAALLKKYGGKLPADKDSLKSLMSTEKLSPYSVRNAAATRGTDIHSDLEKLAAGTAVKPSAENQGLLNWWAERGLNPADVLAVEVPLVSFEFQYAGTVDIIYKDPETGKIRLCDLKTGNFVHWTHFVQGEAYRHAYEEQGGHVDEVTVLHAPPMPKDEFLKMAAMADGSKPTGGWDEKLSREVTFDTFRSILEIYRWLPEDWNPEEV